MPYLVSLLLRVAKAGITGWPGENFTITALRIQGLAQIMPPFITESFTAESIISMEFCNITMSLKHTIGHFRWNVQIETRHYYAHTQAGLTSAGPCVWVTVGPLLLTDWPNTTFLELTCLIKTVFLHKWGFGVCVSSALGTQLNFMMRSSYDCLLKTN